MITFDTQRRAKHPDLKRFLKQTHGHPPKENTKGEKVKAFINHGSWVAYCPHGCRSALLVSKQQPVFLCTDCEDNCWHDVEFPHNMDKIEGILEKRPKVNQNWEIDEDIDTLKAENIAHGLEA